MTLVYDRQTFAPKRQHRYTGEGWGLTHDRTSLIMSDGSEFLRIIDPATFTEKKRVRVQVGGQALKNLNELEFVKGEVFANVWQTDYVARIEPDHRSGHRLHRLPRPADTRRAQPSPTC